MLVMVLKDNLQRRHVQSTFQKEKQKLELMAISWHPFESLKSKSCQGKVEFTSDLVTAGERQYSPYCHPQNMKASILAIKRILNKNRKSLNANSQGSN